MNLLLTYHIIFETNYKIDVSGLFIIPNFVTKDSFVLKKQ